MCKYHILQFFIDYSCEFESRSWQGVLDTTLCDKFVSKLWQGMVFSAYSGFLHHNITETELQKILKSKG